MAAGASPIRTDGGSSAVIARPAAQIPPNPSELAQKLLSENGGAKKPNLSELQRKLDAISIQDGALGGQIRAEVEKLLTPVQRGQLASATYMQDGVKIVPNGKSLAEQFRAPANSADRANYNALDKRYGDGNPKTNDSARIQQKINEQIASGLPLAKFLAQDRAVEKDWTAKAGDFLANFSPTGLLLEAAQPGIAALAKSAGLGNSEWGAHLQRVLDTPGTARAFNAGIQEGLVEGAKSFVVDIASIAGKAAQYVGDVSPGGFVGDAARWATPDAVKGWLKEIGVGGAINAVVPSAKRGYENTQALAKAGEAVGSYFANHTPGQVADDVKAKIGQMWDGIKADHAKAAAKGPEAEARWWGKIVGRATFEVASTFVPVAGQAGKVAKGAQAADKVADVIRVTDKVADAVKAGDKVADAVRAGDKLEDAVKAGERIVNTVPARAGEKIAAGVREIPQFILDASKRTGISPQKIQEILDIPKPTGPMDRLRPHPTTYMSKAQIAAHLAKFDEGAIRFTSKASFAKYGTLGPQGGFIMPAKEFSDLLLKAKGDLKLVEKSLGLDPGTLSAGDTLIAFIEKKDLSGLRIPTGNEGGVHPSLWRPGGYTDGGISEAVMDFTKSIPYQEVQL
jgi:hypothetical protein